MPNLILGKEQFPELLQYDATPQKIADAAIRILKDPQKQATMKRGLDEVSQKLGAPGANRRAAEEILALL